MNVAQPIPPPPDGRQFSEPFAPRWLFTERHDVRAQSDELAAARYVYHRETTPPTAAQICAARAQYGTPRLPKREDYVGRIVAKSTGDTRRELDASAHAEYTAMARRQARERRRAARAVARRMPRLAPRMMAPRRAGRTPRPVRRAPRRPSRRGSGGGGSGGDGPGPAPGPTARELLDLALRIARAEPPAPGRAVCAYDVAGFGIIEITELAPSDVDWPDLAAALAGELVAADIGDLIAIGVAHRGRWCLARVGARTPAINSRGGAA